MNPVLAGVLCLLVIWCCWLTFVHLNAREHMTQAADDVDAAIYRVDALDGVVHGVVDHLEGKLPQASGRHVSTRAD